MFWQENDNKKSRFKRGTVPFKQKNHEYKINYH